MLSRVRPLALALVAGLALGAGACGGKNKGGSTTPGGGAGGGDAVGMNDQDPVGGGAPGGGGGGAGSETLPGGGGGGDDGPVLPEDGGPGDGGKADESKPPPIVPPNHDPDPAQARTAVRGHLDTARNALRSSPADPDLAIREARAALAVDGTSVDAVVVLAHAYYHKRLYDTAETILDMLVKDREVARKHPGVYYVYGLVYDKLGDAPRAFTAYKKAVELKPDYGSALVNLGVHQLRNKQYDEAMATFEKLTGQLGYKDAATLNSLGSAYRGKSADYDPGSRPRADWLLKAEATYQAARSADRTYGPVHYNLGLLYLDADPFPAPGGGNLDTLVRLQKAKAYFEEYKNLPGVDMKLVDDRMKNVTRLISREEKKRKKGGS